jgi:hypothetical protein
MTWVELAISALSFFAKVFGLASELHSESIGRTQEQRDEYQDAAQRADKIGAIVARPDDLDAALGRMRDGSA